MKLPNLDFKTVTSGTDLKVFHGVECPNCKHTFMPPMSDRPKCPQCEYTYDPHLPPPLTDEEVRHIWRTTNMGSTSRERDDNLIRAGFEVGVTAGLKAARDGMASKLIDTWSATHGGKQVPWRIAVGIVAVIGRLPKEEENRLLSLDDGA